MTWGLLQPATAARGFAPASHGETPPPTAPDCCDFVLATSSVLTSFKLEGLQIGSRMLCIL